MCFLIIVSIIRLLLLNSVHPLKDKFLDMSSPIKAFGNDILQIIEKITEWKDTKQRKQVKNIYYIAKREIGSYFASPIAYIVLTIFLFIFGYFFIFYLNSFNAMNMQAMRNAQIAEKLNINQIVFTYSYVSTAFILLLISPLITMRLFAEEKKTKTIELLMTSPINMYEMVLGKFLAALFLVLAMFSLTLYSIPVVFYVGTPELAPMLSVLLGMALMSASFVAIGVFSSTLTENQIISAVVSFGILLIFWIIKWMAPFVEGDLGSLLNALSIESHLDNFAKGVIVTSDIVYYLSFIVFWLFCSHRVLESSRWK